MTSSTVFVTAAVIFTSSMDVTLSAPLSSTLRSSERASGVASALPARASAMSEDELYAFAKEIGAPFHLLKETARLKRLPVVNFAAGGIATPGTLLPSRRMGEGADSFVYSGRGADDAVGV